MKRLEIPEPVYNVRKLKDVLIAEKPKKILYIEGSLGENGFNHYMSMLTSTIRASKSIGATVKYIPRNYLRAMDLTFDHAKLTAYLKSLDGDFAVLAHTCLCCAENGDLTTKIDAQYRAVGENSYILLPEMKDCGTGIDRQIELYARHIPQLEWNFDLSDTFLSI
jgi:hypothetical protein